jgi:DNA-binding transcriptional MerR regulator
VKISELAAATQTPVATIRYYEQEGLVPEPARTGANYRSYGPAHVLRLAFIRRCRSLDMSLDEVRVLLRLQDQLSPAMGAPGTGDAGAAAGQAGARLPEGGPAPAKCGEVHSVLDEHIVHVTQRVRELRRLEKQLRDLRAHCSSAPSGHACGILEQLNTAPDSKALPARKPVPGHAHGGLAEVDVHAGRAPAKGP